MSYTMFYKDVAMYLRKSRAEENEDTGEVLARHRAQLTKFAAHGGITVRKVFEEVVSGDSLFARPRMIELLHDVEAGLYSGVLCMDIDRLGRGNMQEQGLILNTFKDAGTAIITPDKTYDLNDELDETQTEFKTFFARQELKMIKKRLMRGRTMTIEKGGYVSNPPFGYVRAYKEKLPTLVPDPSEAEAVRKIFELYISGEGCQSIANIMKNMGVTPHRGDTFNRTSIRRILTNPVYIGKIIWNQKKYIRPKAIGEKTRVEYLDKSDWMIFEGLHPAIIDDVTFKRANQMLEGKYHAPYREPDQIINPLAGILFCRKCGHAITRRPFSSGRKYQTTHLLCQTPGCVKSARADLIEQQFIQILEEKLKDLEASVTAQRMGEEHVKAEQTLSLLNAELTKLKTQRVRVYDLLEQGAYTIDVFNDREKAVTEKINSVGREIERIQSRSSKLKEQADVLIPKIRSLLQEYWNCTPAEKNALLKDVIERATYFKDKAAKPGDFIIEIQLKQNYI